MGNFIDYLVRKAEGAASMMSPQPAFKPAFELPNPTAPLETKSLNHGIHGPSTILSTGNIEPITHIKKKPINIRNIKPTDKSTSPGPVPAKPGIPGKAEPAFPGPVKPVKEPIRLKKQAPEPGLTGAGSSSALVKSLIRVRQEPTPAKTTGDLTTLKTVKPGPSPKTSMVTPNSINPLKEPKRHKKQVPALNVPEPGPTFYGLKPVSGVGQIPIPVEETAGAAAQNTKTSTESVILQSTPSPKTGTVTPGSVKNPKGFEIPAYPGEKIIETTPGKESHQEVLWTNIEPPNLDFKEAPGPGENTVNEIEPAIDVSNRFDIKKAELTRNTSPPPVKKEIRVNIGTVEIKTPQQRVTNPKPQVRDFDEHLLSRVYLDRLHW